jgi:hypothetical protein
MWVWQLYMNQKAPESRQIQTPLSLILSVFLEVRRHRKDYCQLNIEGQSVLARFKTGNVRNLEFKKVCKCRSRDDHSSSSLNKHQPTCTSNHSPKA